MSKLSLDCVSLRYRSLVLIAAALLAGTWATLPGCESGPKTYDTDVKVMGFDELVKQIANPASTVALIDVRQREAYLAGHIPTAINIPVAEIMAADPRLATAQTLVVYSRSGLDRLSLASAKKLISLRYSNVFEYRGGLEEWKSQGRPLVLPPVEPKPATQPASN